jgi:hypothetical protein
MFFACLVAMAETMIALALIAGFARKLTYLSAIVFSLLIWATAGGFGGLYTAGAAGIGTAIICAGVHDCSHPVRLRGLGAVVPGNPTTAGMHTGTLTFTPRTGTYEYLCPVPGHAQMGRSASTAHRDPRPGSSMPGPDSPAAGPPLVMGAGPAARRAHAGPGHHEISPGISIKRPRTAGLDLPLTHRKGSAARLGCATCHG